jgi:hypothetical protein
VFWHFLAMLYKMFSVAPPMTDPVEDDEELHHHIMKACQTIHTHPGVCEQLPKSMM